MLPLDLINKQRKFWKIQRKNKETRYFSFSSQKQFCSISKKVCCIPEALTLLLTPILKYICMLNDRCHIRKYVINDIYDISDMWHLAFGMCMYFNMGVKWSVRTSGMQQTKYTTKLFLRPKTDISCFLIFPLYFSNFPLYIICGLRDP